MNTEVKPLNIEAYIRIGLATLFGIAALGGMMGFFSRWLYLVCLFPLLAGAIVGGVVAMTAQTYQIRSKLFVLLWALVFSFGIYAMYHFTEYLVLLSQLSETALRPTFIEYMQLSAAIGTMIGQQEGSSEPLITLATNATYILWTVEVLLCCGAACLIGVLGMKTPKTNQVATQ